MSAADVWEDALNLAEGLRYNLLRSEPTVRLQIPFSVFLSGLTHLAMQPSRKLRASGKVTH